MIYSTRSATADNRKWRALVPVEPPISGADYHDTANALFDLVEDASLGAMIPDRALARPAQLIYLPNAGAHYENGIVKGDRLKLTPDHPIIVRREGSRSVRAALEAEARSERERRQRDRASRIGCDASVVDAFNANHDLGAELDRHGYKRLGGSNDWRSPMQTSRASHATRAYGNDYWISLSASDAAAGIGRPSRCGGGCFGDAFDLFVYFDHGGDFTEAVRAYAREIGMKFDSDDGVDWAAFAEKTGRSDRGAERDDAGSTAEKPASGDWPDPAPIVSRLPPVEPFVPALLPACLSDYVLDVAERQQAPADFAAVVAVCALAAIVGNRVKVRPKRLDDWEVVPNLWGVIIGRPSAMKSPGMRAALAPVYAMQDRATEQWERETREAGVEAMLAGLDAKEAKKRAEKAMKAGDKDAAREILEAMLKGSEIEAGSAPRLIVNDATVEKLGELLNKNPRGLLLERDELPGWLARMEREEFQGERAFYLEAFNGDGQFTYDRIGRGTLSIRNCTLSVIGGAQPSRIARIVSGALTGQSNDGLVQRLQMAVWPDDLGSWRWVDRAPNCAAREAYDAAFEAMDAIATACSETPMVLRFSETAQAMFREWMEEIQSEARNGGLPSTLESHLLKMPKTVASLALLFELVDGGRLEIGQEATGRALGWAEYLRSHANRLYASADTAYDDAARMIVERRAQLPVVFSARDIHQRGWAGLADREAVSAALAILIETNHCREIQKPAGRGGGRPTSNFRWHPSLGA